MRSAGRRGVLSGIILILLLASVSASGCTLPGTNSTLEQAPSKVATTTILSGTPLPAQPTPLFTVTAAPSPTPEAVTEPLPASGVVFDPTYTWEYKNVGWSFTMVIPEEAYRYFREKPRTPGMSYADYALADEDQQTLEDVALKIKAGGEGQGYSAYDNAMNVLTFVQSLPYSRDIDTVGVAEYPRYPIETLKDGTGDCEDKTILAAALLRKMDIDAVILMLPDHSAVGINVPGATGICYEYEGKTYYYGETTSGNWTIGDQPAELQSLSARVVPMKKSPVLGLHVTASSVRADNAKVYFNVKYSVESAGPGTANGLVFRVKAYDPDGGEDALWEPEQTIRLGDLEEGRTTSGETTLAVPLGKYGKIACVLTGDNIDDKKVQTDSFQAVK